MNGRDRVFRSVPVKQDEQANTPMKKELYLGLDVHQEWILSAVAEEGRGGEVRDTGAIRCDLHAVEKWVGRLRKGHGKEVVLRACYEAGPCGWKAQNRLHSRYTRLAARRLQRNKAIVAIARELCGFIWELLRTQRCYQAQSTSA